MTDEANFETFSGSSEKNALTERYPKFGDQHHKIDTRLVRIIFRASLVHCVYMSGYTVLLLAREWAGRDNCTGCGNASISSEITKNFSSKLHCAYALLYSVFLTSFP